MNQVYQIKFKNFDDSKIENMSFFIGILVGIDWGLKICHFCLRFLRRKKLGKMKWQDILVLTSFRKMLKNQLRRPKGWNQRPDSDSGGSNWLVRVFKHSRSRTRAESEMDQLLLTNPRIEPKWSNRGFGSMGHLMQNFVSFPTVPLLFESVIWSWSKMDFSDSIQFHFMDFWMSEKNCQNAQCASSNPKVIIRFIKSSPFQARCLKITQKVSFNITSEASYVFKWVDKSVLKMPK